MAIALATKLAMRPLMARAHRGLGTLYERGGQSGLARAHLASARSMAAELRLHQLPGE
jgi:hypothetical protein